MKLALSLFLGRPIPRGQFEGTAGEMRTYESAVRMLRAARFRGLSRVLYHSALKSSRVRTAMGDVVEYRRRA
jgi:hypothetical protein